MPARYAPPKTRALRDFPLQEPRVRPSALALLRALAGPYLRLGIGCTGVTTVGVERLAEAFRAALAGEIRLIVAFRHPFMDEPQILGTLFLNGLPREARRRGIRLPRQPHALFVHGYEVPRWGGALVRWLLPRMGALPVHHSRMDTPGMARIRRAITDGPYPVALAPEGQVSYSSGTIPRLEAGTMRLGLEAAQTLAAAGRSEPVIVLPLSVHRRYGGGRYGGGRYGTGRAERSLERLLRRVERFAGTGEEESARLPRVLEAVLRQAEGLYGLASPPSSLSPASPPDRDTRLRAVVEAAVTAGERILGIAPGVSAARDSVIQRVYRIRQAGWDRIYIGPTPQGSTPQGSSPERMTPLARALADRRAGEAWYAMRHMELADFAWYFHTTPPIPEAPLEERAEYVQNLWDFANRLAGGAISQRRHVRPFRELLSVGEAINLSQKLEGYGTSRKATVTAATEELYRSFLRAGETVQGESGSR